MEEKKKFGASTWVKFLVFSAIGVFLFFINVPFRGKTTVPMLHIINNIKAAVPGRGNEWLVFIMCISTVVTGLLARLPNAPAWLKAHHPRDTWFSWFTYITAAIFAVMVVFNVGPVCFIDPKVGMASLNVARDVIYAVIIAGGLVAFLTEFGLLEFLGVLLEPVMRKLFRVPGKASIDALSSFVCAPSVAVMITNDLYKQKVYTQREAVAITTSFSFCSLGGFAFMSGMVKCGDRYGTVVLTALLMAFVLAAIMVRIPPISKKKDIYIDGAVQTAEDRKIVGYNSETLPRAADAALTKAKDAPPVCILTKALAAVGFAQKVAAYIMSLSVIFLALANYTPVVDWLGVPIAPILRLFRLPDVEIIAPCVLSGFFALSLPSTLVAAAGEAVSVAAGFFVIVLSTSQVIFFTESANAMMESEVPVNFKDLLIIFLERTAFLIPLVALMTHIIFHF